MTDTRPPRCHYDRATRDRMTNQHLDTCPDPTSCDGCEPCTHDHCVLCRARHTTQAHPNVCPTCISGIREDLDVTLARIGDLHDQAIHGARDGRLQAAAPIPGGDALVLLGPAGNRETAAHRWDSAKAGRLKKSRLFAHYSDDHRGRDLEPPLSLLAAWEDVWRTYLRNPAKKLATQASAVKFLGDNLTLMAQVQDGPDITVFARDIASLRARLEQVLHDEQQPERGVECFECGVRLLRRIRSGKRCACGPRPVLRHAVHGRCTCPAELRLEQDAKGNIVPTQVRDHAPVDGHVHPRSDLSCIACHSEAEWDNRHTKHRQGGVDDPAPGFSWECPGCRKEYTPGEYARAVRLDLAETHEDEDGRQIGWTTLPIAAEAAAEQSGRPITANTLRTWATRALERRTTCEHSTSARMWLKTVESYPELGPPSRGEVSAALLPCSRCVDPGIATACQWEPGRRFGVQLVFWPDVADRISEQRKSGRPSKNEVA